MLGLNFRLCSDLFCCLVADLTEPGLRWFFLLLLLLLSLGLSSIFLLFGFLDSSGSFGLLPLIVVGFGRHLDSMEFSQVVQSNQANRKMETNIL